MEIESCRDIKKVLLFATDFSLAAWLLTFEVPPSAFGVKGFCFIQAPLIFSLIGTPIRNDGDFYTFYLEEFYLEGHLN